MWLGMMGMTALAAPTHWPPGTETTDLIWSPASLYHIAWVGDIDGDGTDDVVGSGGTTFFTAAFVYLGPASWYTWSSVGPSQELRFAGFAGVEHVAPAGDVNGDGYADVVVTTYDPYGYSPTEVLLLRGRPSGLDPAPLQTLTGAGLGDGYYTTGVGDLNGDGYDDVAVPTLDGTNLDILYGSPTGWVVPAGDTLAGRGMGWGTPWMVGDLDGDGFDDLVVGVTWTFDLDLVDVYRGSPTGLSATPDYTLTGPKNFGTAVAAGDFDGDGALELAVAAYTGITRIYDWSAAGPSPVQTLPTSGFGWLSVGDVDGDGATDLMVSDKTHCTLWRYDGAELVLTDTFAALGSTRIRGAGPGDADANGLDDVLCGDSSDGTLWLAWPDEDDDGFEFGGDEPTDCDDTRASVHVGATEVVGNGIDENCDGTETCYTDLDADGYRSPNHTTSADTDCDDPGEALPSSPGGDCNDNDPAVSPGAADLAADGVDSDCDGVERCYADVDDDGARSTTLIAGTPGCSASGQALESAQIDCDDNDATRTPGGFDTPEDGVDNDCNGFDSCWADLDDDSWLTGATIDTLDADCSDPGEGLDTEPKGDCDDSSAAVNPGVADTPGTGVDEDCDGIEACWVDADADGYSSSDVVLAPDFDCVDAGENEDSDPKGDCDDTRAAVNPGRTDVPGDFVDADCDGGEDCFADVDLDGFRSGVVFTSADLDCEDPGEAVGPTPSDCDDADGSVFPGAAEIVGDSVDSDCDGHEVCFADTDHDGAGGAADVVSADVDCGAVGEAALSDDCDDADPAVAPGAAETCDGVDQDCDELVDEDADDATSWWADGDADGYGAGSVTAACEAPPGSVPLGDEDCDDAATTTFPGAAEVLGDGVDQDCDGADATSEDAGGDVAGAPEADDKPTGCGCTTPGPPAISPLLVLVLPLVARRRRKAAGPRRGN